MRFSLRAVASGPKTAGETCQWLRRAVSPLLWRQNESKNAVGTRVSEYCSACGRVCRFGSSWTAPRGEEVMSQKILAA